MSSPQPYGPPPVASGYQQVPARPTNSLALVSLILSIVGWFTIVTAIGGIICGHIARRQIRRTGEGGAGMALWGLIIGYAAVAIVLVSVVVSVVLVVVFGIGIFAVVSESPEAPESASALVSLLAA